MLPDMTFVNHPELLHHPPGCRVATKMIRTNSIKFSGRKAILENRISSLGAIALVPVRPADPEAELGALMLGLKAQTYGARQFSRIPQDDRKNDRFLGIKLGMVLGNPLFRHHVRIGVWNTQGRIGNQAVTGQPPGRPWRPRA